MWNRLSAIAAIALLVSTAHCASNSEIGLLAKAEQLALEGDFAAAIPVLRERLIENPGDAGAHYYLGWCYFAGENFLPVMAEGEFLAGLKFFEGQKDTSPIERFTPAYFELISYINCAKVSAKVIQTLIGYGAEMNLLESNLKKGREYLELARAVKPDAEEIEVMERILNGFETRILNADALTSNRPQ